MTFVLFLVTTLLFAAADPIQLPGISLGKKCIDTPTTFTWSYIWVHEVNLPLAATKKQCLPKKNGIDVKPK
jgi:hypothetical protein|tara:strand:+ start:1880 stop:2092 length:213 start_codon:yes stop_codon:yes gene_type:complete